MTSRHSNPRASAPRTVARSHRASRATDVVLGRSATPMSNGRVGACTCGISPRQCVDCARVTGIQKRLDSVDHRQPGADQQYRGLSRHPGRRVRMPWVPEVGALALVRGKLPAASTTPSTEQRPPATVNETLRGSSFSATAWSGTRNRLRPLPLFHNSSHSRLRT